MSPAPRLHAEGLRRHRSLGVLLGLLVLWQLYLVSSFRNPLDPIRLSDENAGGVTRQLLFASTGAWALLLLWSSRTLGPLLALRRREAAVALLLAGSLLWSVDPTLTLKRSLLFVLGLAALVTVTHATPRPVRLMQRTVTVFTGSVAWLSLALWFLLPRECVENPGRPGLAGLSNHPNTLAPFLVLGLLVSLGRREKGRALLVQRLFQLGQVAALLATRSMTSLAQLVVSLVLFGALAGGAYLRGSFQLAGAGLVLLVAVAGPSTVADAALGSVGRDASLSGRDELWAAVSREASERPWVGHGFGGFWYEGRGREMVATWNPRQAHQAYLDAFADLGVLGLLTVVLLLHFPLLGAWLRHRSPPGTPRRRAMASLMATCLGVLFVYANGQSFLFKLDSYPFFVCLWAVLLLTNEDANDLDAEFGPVTAPPARGPRVLPAAD